MASASEKLFMKAGSVFRPAGKGQLKPRKEPGSKASHVVKIRAVRPKDPVHRKIHALIAHVAEQLRVSKASAVAASAAGSQADSQYVHLTFDKATGKPVTVVDSKGKDTPAVSDVKTVERPFGSERDFARTLLGNRPIYTFLLQDFGTTNSSVNTALAFAAPADLTLANGYSNWFNLFDEVRMTEVICKFMVYVSAPTISANDNAGAVWAMNFDPTQAAAPGSIISVLSAARNCGPANFYTFTGGSLPTPQYATGTIMTTTKGHHIMSSGKLTQGLLPPSSGGVLSPSPVGGDWVSTSSAALVAGWFKFYAEAISANMASGIRIWFEFKTEFRFRG